MSNVSVVWVYKASGAEDSLNLSIASVITNLTGVDNFVVCGDDPKNQSVRHLHCPVISPEAYFAETGTTFATKWRKWIDSIHKLKTIVDDPRVHERFFWMYDDTIVFRKCDVQEYAVPIYNGTLGKDLAPRHENRTWRQCRLRTSLDLDSRRLPYRDYSTHAPMLFEKSKLSDVIDEFGCYLRPRVIESLYGNYWFPRGGRDQKSKKHRHLFRYFSHQETLPPESHLPNILNIGNGKFERFRRQLEESLGYTGAEFRSKPISRRSRRIMSRRRARQPVERPAIEGVTVKITRKRIQQFAKKFAETDTKATAESRRPLQELAERRSLKLPCPNGHRGPYVETKGSSLCGERGRQIGHLYQCSKFDELVAIRPYAHAGRQAERTCLQCPVFHNDI